MATTIRPYQTTDFKRAMALGHMMHQESYYSFMKMSEEKVRQLFEHSVGNDGVHFNVAEKDGEIVGFFYGLTHPHFFSEENVTGDLFFYVRKDLRGSMIGVRLIKGFTDWSKKQNVSYAQIGITTNINTDRSSALLERMGYEFGGTLYRKE